MPTKSATNFNGAIKYCKFLKGKSIVTEQEFIIFAQKKISWEEHLNSEKPES